MALYVQYGCGHCAPDGWLNFDSSPTLRGERLLGRLVRKNTNRFPPNVRYGDVVRGLPVPTGAAAGVYASHVLEHLALDDFRRALGETYRILAPGGIFRAVVPDLEAMAGRYLDDLQNGAHAEAAPRFMRSTHLGHEQRARGFSGLARAWLGNSAHLWMWDFPSLAAELDAHGFCNIRRCSYHDGAPVFQRVEDATRFEDAVAIEAKRPQ